MTFDYKTTIVDAILAKKQLEGFPKEFVVKKVEQYFLREGRTRKEIEQLQIKTTEQFLRNKKVKIVVKTIREEIGVVYGVFLTQRYAKKENELEKISNQEELKQLLPLHKSTRERQEFYKEIYTSIFDWYTPQAIADIACGFNPFAYHFLPQKPSTYLAVDINPHDTMFIQKAFDKVKIKGKGKAYDLTEEKILEDEDIQTCDLVFLFKALDSLEYTKRNSSKVLLKGLKAKHIVVSFPTQSLVAQQTFNMQKRAWFFNFIEKEQWTYITREVENELFVFITKN